MRATAVRATSYASRVVHPTELAASRQDTTGSERRETNTSLCMDAQSVRSSRSSRTIRTGDGGLIKWISQTERDGTCKLPTRDDLVLFAKNCQPKFPKCGSGK